MSVGSCYQDGCDAVVYDINTNQLFSQEHLLGYLIYVNYNWRLLDSSSWHMSVARLRLHDSDTICQYHRHLYYSFTQVVGINLV